MRAFGVVEAPPLLDQHLRLFQSVKDLAVQAFVPQFSIKAFAIAILPWRTGLDVERLHIQFAEPVTHGLSDKLWPIVRTNVLWRSVTDEELSKNVQHVLTVEFAPDMDRKTFPCVFIDNAQHAERPTVMGSVHHEVIAPYMVL